MTWRRDGRRVEILEEAQKADDYKSGWKGDGCARRVGVSETLQLGGFWSHSRAGESEFQACHGSGDDSTRIRPTWMEQSEGRNRVFCPCCKSRLMGQDHVAWVSQPVLQLQCYPNYLDFFSIVTISIVTPMSTILAFIKHE
jgi:hypothetical protein